MRITSGTFRGRILKSPDGLSTRPTSDRARQAMFNILTHAAWGGPGLLDDAPILDVYAGTGALGLEALSRGAAHAVFIEEAPAALSALRANLTACRVTDRTHVLATSALQLPARPPSLPPRRLVFCDPPYNAIANGEDLGRQAITQLAARGWLAPDCVLVMEMAKKYPEAAPADCEIMDERTYGVALVRFLRWTGSV